MLHHLFINSGKLTLFIIRRDRVRIPIWLISIATITFIVAVAFTDLYPSELERQAIAETMKNPAMTAMIGKGYGLDNYTIGAMMAHQMLLFTALTVGLMSILLTARHTRADEEDGRIELIRSLPVGRLSNLGSTIIVLCGINILLALIIGIGMYLLRIESMDLEGSLLYGIALGATGIFFTGITAVFAQLSENSRGTIGMAFTVLGLAYLIRAIGDVSNEAISWLSPLGLIMGSEVYVNNYWWPILLNVGIAFIFIILAFYLNAIRDLESGFLLAKPGRKNASVFLQSPLGLALRLQRTGIIAWMIGMYVLGASYGSVFGDIEVFFEDNEMIEQLLSPVEGFSLTEQFLAMLMSIMAMISTIPTLMAILKAKGEEKKNRTEHILSRAVSRTKLLASYFFVSFGMSFIALSLTAVGLWSAAIATMDDGFSFRMVYHAAIVYLPAIWIMVGISVLIIGFLPKLTGLTWLYLGYSFFVVYLGGLFQFPDWMSKLSPFGQIPQLPIEEMDYMKVAILTLIAIGIIFIGFIGYNKRDIEG